MMFELDELRRINSNTADMRFYLLKLTEEIAELNKTMRALADALKRNPEDARLP